MERRKRGRRREGRNERRGEGKRAGRREGRRQEERTYRRICSTVCPELHLRPYLPQTVSGRESLVHVFHMLRKVCYSLGMGGKYRKQVGHR